jgi:hypothetical protein
LELVNAIKPFFDDERRLFCVDTLGLSGSENAIRGTITVLPFIAQWLKLSTCLPGNVRYNYIQGHFKYKDLQSSMIMSY